MVNASLNWASIVGIVLAVGGAFLYFMRSFKPALARDYDVFFAAVGLLCGGILFFQGWRLDPILQFGQFLLASTTVFFAYESVRLRGVTTEQARRSSYFDDDEPLPGGPRGGFTGGRPWDNEPDRFEEPEPLRRRIPSQGEPEEDFYRPRRTSRAAIPERAASRRPPDEDWESPLREPPAGAQRESDASAYRASGRRGDRSEPADFGARRRDRQEFGAARRGSRPTPSPAGMPRSSRRGGPSGSAAPDSPGGPESVSPPGVPQGSPIRGGRGQANQADLSDADFSSLDAAARPGTRPSSSGVYGVSGRQAPSPPSGARSDNGTSRDNSSRFDD